MAAALGWPSESMLNQLQALLDDPESDISSLQLTFTVRPQPDERAGLSTELGDDVLEALAALPAAGRARRPLERPDPHRRRGRSAPEDPRCPAGLSARGAGGRCSGTRNPGRDHRRDGRGG